MRLQKSAVGWIFRAGLEDSGHSAPSSGCTESVPRHRGTKQNRQSCSSINKSVHFGLDWR